jgi:hypothetical protein
MIRPTGALERAAAAPDAPRDGGRFHLLQAIEDAICWRTGRLAQPCHDCGPDGRCDDHSRDAGLITAYQRTARQLQAGS